MAGKNQIEASKLPPLSQRLDELDKQEAEEAKSIISDDPPPLPPLDTMSREELIKLVQKVYQAGWGYGKLTGKELVEMALKTKDDAYEALKLTALTLAVNASEWREFTALATFWAEREKGKPVQSVNATVTVGVVEIVEHMMRSQVIDVTPKG